MPSSSVIGRMNRPRLWRSPMHSEMMSALRTSRVSVERREAIMAASIRLSEGALGAATFLGPDPAKRLEQVGDRRALRAQRVEAVLLGGEQVALGVEDLELAAQAVLVAQAREPQRDPERCGAIALGVETLARLDLRDQRVAHLAERVLHGELVLRERLPLARVRCLDLRLDAPALVDRRSERDRGLPDPGGSG